MISFPVLLAIAPLTTTLPIPLLLLLTSLPSSVYNFDINCTGATVVVADEDVDDDGVTIVVAATAAVSIPEGIVLLLGTFPTTLVLILILALCESIFSDEDEDEDVDNEDGVPKSTVPCPPVLLKVVLRILILAELIVFVVTLLILW